MHDQQSAAGWLVRGGLDGSSESLRGPGNPQACVFPECGQVIAFERR
jgi:hypothetical protein